ncbi:amine acid ABC transporter, permease protein, 3-TM region, His/Glu/Gln/Arg/opine family [Beggiatoa alba B18LD]|uniref:Arginine ABC transporter permease protein ArtM n=1 Tax=Beggiatoa alba B18LD TaxID=395493 RepID=I3CGP9_9GAMM|nr:ABC transporter permease [Beggiatoa alba]EIJ42792.1 amine acid ABC transporter, permease protein, 3-TM region, His/Glu/Gln/Arg/opine family [Beggiatoa alba B18LD]
MNFSVIIDNFHLYWEGLGLTIELVSLSLLLGIFIAIPCAVLATLKNPFYSIPVFAFSYFFRGTPLLIQIYLIYYGLGQFDWIKASIFWHFLREAYWCALLAFTLNTAAYTIEILRGTIVSMPIGEIEAAKAFGMSPTLIYRRIILPSALRRALPAYGNEVIFMLHASSLASVITLIDITGAARIVNSRFYMPYEAFLTAGAFYLVLTFTLVFSFKYLEKRWLSYL